MPSNPPRPLTDRERLLTRWIIDHGDASQEEKAELLSQLDLAMVVRRCPCGCPSVDFAIAGEESDHHGMRIVGDFVCGDEASLTGVFVFCRRTVLAGLEIYQLGGDTRNELPTPQELRAFRSTQSRT